MISTGELSVNKTVRSPLDAVSTLLPYVALLVFGLIMAGAFLYLEWRTTGALTGVPLDDSWIHFRFADNLRRGNGMSFNPGEPTPGSTAPLWAAILSVAGAGYVVPAKTIGILAYLASGILVYLFSLKIGMEKFIALFAGLGALAAGRLIWAAPSGMETTLFTALSLWSIYLWARGSGTEIPVGASIVMGLACLLRPEGYLLLAISILLWALSVVKRRHIGGFTHLFRHVMIVGLIILPYIGFSYLTTGRPLPNTFYVKSSAWGCEPSTAYVGWISSIFFLDNPVMFLFAGYGLVEGFRTGEGMPNRWFRLASLWLILLPAAYGFIAPCLNGHYARYFVPLIPVLLLIAGFGAEKFRSKLPGWVRRIKRTELKVGYGRNFTHAILVEGTLLALLPTFLYWAPFYAQSVLDIQEMQVKVAHWLAAQTQPEDILAVNDIGAIGMLADRNVIDLVGLVSPEIIPLVESRQPGEWDEGLALFLAAEQPQYLVIYPTWYPELSSLLPGEPVYSAQLPSRLVPGFPQLSITGGGELVVFRLNW